MFLFLNEFYINGGRGKGVEEYRKQIIYTSMTKFDSGVIAEEGMSYILAQGQNHTRTTCQLFD